MQGLYCGHSFRLACSMRGRSQAHPEVVDMRDMRPELAADLSYAPRRPDRPCGVPTDREGPHQLVAPFDLIIEENELDLDAIGLQHLHFRIKHCVFSAELA